MPPLAQERPLQQISALTPGLWGPSGGGGHPDPGAGGAPREAGVTQPVPPHPCARSVLPELRPQLQGE